jgi:hypothetical protein
MDVDGQAVLKLLLDVPATRVGQGHDAVYVIFFPAE